LNIDLIVASSIFLIFISVVLFYIFGFQKQVPSWQSLIELRKEASELANEIISKGTPSDWNKENIIPSKIGLASSTYLIPILIFDTSGYNRINEPISQEIVFDEECKNLAWNGTVRIFDENFNEVPFKFINKTFCPSGFLQKAILFFEINVSANSSRKLQIFFYNSTQVNPKDYGNFSSLVMWLTFDEGNGTIAKDSSGYNNDGTLYNSSTVCSNPPTSGCPTWVNGKFGKAISFDGIDDYVDVGEKTTLRPTSLTVEAWVNFNQLPSQVGHWMSFVSKHSAYKGYVLEGASTIYPDRIVGVMADGSNWRRIPGPTIQVGRWYHVVLTYDGTMKFYVDGTLYGSDTFTLVQDAVTPLQIGRSATYGNYFSGIVDEVRIYNRALSEEEILSHYQQSLIVKVFPRTEVSLISFDKIEALRNISYDLLKDVLQKGYNFRVEIYEK
jgi:hypothetical protein